MEQLGITIIQGVVAVLIAFITGITGWAAGRRTGPPPQPVEGGADVRAVAEAVARLEASHRRVERAVAAIDRQSQRTTSDVATIASAIITLVTHLDDEIPPKAGDTIIGKVSALRSREVTSLHTRAM